MSDFGAGLYNAEHAIKQIVPAIVARHRQAGVLTWRLMHQIEDEVMAELAATGKHSKQLIRMLGSQGLMNYPKDETEVSLKGHEAVPIVFSEVNRAWHEGE